MCHLLLQQPSSLAAKVAQRRRRRSSSNTPPPAREPQGHAAQCLPGSLPGHPPAPCGGFTALLGTPLQPDVTPGTTAGLAKAQQQPSQLTSTTPGSSFSQYAAGATAENTAQQSAVQHCNGEVPATRNTSGAFPEDSSQGHMAMQGDQTEFNPMRELGLNPPEAAGARALAGLDPQPPVRPDQSWPVPHVLRSWQSVATAVVRPPRSVSCNLASTTAAPGRLATTEVNQSGTHLRRAGSGPAPAVQRGFGGILSGVVKEAAETATKRPPVFRYEDFTPV